MRTRLAWHDLKHRRLRTLTALLGVVFAVTLIFMQTGFYQACRDSAVRIHRLLDYDLMLTAPGYAFIIESGHISRDRLAQARRINGVEAAIPLRVGGRLWRNPQTGNPTELLLLGVRPSDHPFALESLDLDRLTQLDTALFDRAAHPSLGQNPPGTESEIFGHRLRVVGDFHWGAGFVGDGLAIISEESFERIFEPPPSKVEVGLIQLAEGVSPEAVVAQLEQTLPRDVSVWTREEIERRDQRFFLSERPIGLMFTSGMALAVMVGGVILFQILASEVTSRRAELATLQALGYGRRAVYGVVFEQGLLYTIFAFIPASLTAAALFTVTEQLARLPMRLDAPLIAGVFGLSLLMCVLGAFFASRRVRSADPADLF